MAPPSRATAGWSGRSACASGRRAGRVRWISAPTSAFSRSRRPSGDTTSSRSTACRSRPASATSASSFGTPTSSTDRLKVERFDQIINCSSVEHVGLAGPLRQSRAEPDGDLEAMAIMRESLAPGRPDDHDHTGRPRSRLSRRCTGSTAKSACRDCSTAIPIEEQQFWHKDARRTWEPDRPRRGARDRGVALFLFAWPVRSRHIVKPKLTIITPSYNQAAFIERTLRSVLDQGYENLEYLVRRRRLHRRLGGDHRALRGPPRLVGERARRGPDRRPQQGLARATGDVIAYINSDDYYLPGAFDDGDGRTRAHRRTLGGRRSRVSWMPTDTTDARSGGRSLPPKAAALVDPRPLGRAAALHVLATRGVRRAMACSARTCITSSTRSSGSASSSRATCHADRPGARRARRPPGGEVVGPNAVRA